MRTIPKVLICVAIAVVSALAVLPARWLIRALPDTWPVAIVDASGTVWNGSALMAIGPPEARSTLPTPLNWRLAFDGGPHLVLSHLWLDGPMTLRLETRGVILSARTLRLPASTLAQLGAPFNTLKPGGDLSLRWPAMRLNGSVPVGELLTVEWKDASTVLSMLRPIGRYQVRLTGDAGDAIVFAVSTLEGPLMVEGTGRGAQRGGVRFNGVARPAPNSTPEVRAALDSTLSALGRRTGDDSLLQVGR